MNSSVYRSVADARRLSDYEAMQHFQSNVVTWKVMDIDPEGRRGPAYYRFSYNLKGVIGWQAGEPIYHQGFEVNLDLNPPYPTSKARAWFVGTVPWHPNVHPDGRICYEDRWITGVGIALDKICEIIGMMIAFQLFGERHQTPVRTEPEFWKQFERSRHMFPFDPSPVRCGGNIPQIDNSQRIRFG